MSSYDWGPRFVLVFSSVMLIPFIILNFTSFLVGGIWLLFLGEWRLVLFALLVDFIVPLAWWGVLLISLPMGLLAIYLGKTELRTLSLLPAYIGILVGHIAIIFWVFGVVIYMIMISETSSMPYPYLLFGYCIAAGPFQYMASKEPPDSTSSFIGATIAQFSYIIFIFSYLIDYTILALPLIILVTLCFQAFLLQQLYIAQKIEATIT